MNTKQELKYTNSFTPAFSDEAARWQAVQVRDSNADGLFVYAVKTTKIYCRPICKARLARRANVSFYDTGLEAQGAGFRACKRCKPEVDGCMPEERAVRQIRAFVEEQRRRRRNGGSSISTSRNNRSSSSADTRLISLSQMAKQTGLSKWHFHRVFKQCVGVTPSEFLRSEKDAAATAPTTTSQSCTTSGDLSPWTDSDLDIGGRGWPTPREDVLHGFDAGYTLDFALFDMEAASVPWTDDGPLGVDDGSISFDDFLIWPEENGSKKGAVNMTDKS